MSMDTLCTCAACWRTRNSPHVLSIDAAYERDVASRALWRQTTDRGLELLGVEEIEPLPYKEPSPALVKMLDHIREASLRVTMLPAAFWPVLRDEAAGPPPTPPTPPPIAQAAPSAEQVRQDLIWQAVVDVARST